MSMVEGTMSRVIFFFNFFYCCCCLIKIARGHSNSLKAKTLLPSCEGRQVVPQKKISESLGRGTQRLFSVKYLFGGAKIAYNFLLLEEG